ncbi:beta-1,4-glucuronyltransferase 1 [Ciona intestinalis]
MTALCFNMKQLQNYWFSLSIILLVSVLVCLRRCIKTEELISENIFRKYQIKSVLNQRDIIQNPDQVLDKSGKYFVLSNTSYPKLRHPNDVTLVTHSTVDNLLQFSDLLETWKGPLSYTLFVCNKGDYDVISKILLTCFNIQNVSLHFVYPVRDNCNHSSLLNTLKASHNGVGTLPIQTCEKLKNLLRKHKNENYNSQVSYPSNLLRNVGSQNGFVLHLDVDLIPSKNLHQRLKQFLVKNEKNLVENSAFVLPVFEMETEYFEKHRNNFPLDKTSLAQLFQSSVARPFYSTVCPRCQAITNYSKWFQYGNTGELEPVYKVIWQHSYEPFFVAHNPPSFDEGFKQYGYNRVSQLCEMHVAGWGFKILNPGFLIHVGTKEKFHSTKTDEMRDNYQKYQSFQENLEKKYPNSERDCRPPPAYILN